MHTFEKLPFLIKKVNRNTHSKLPIIYPNPILWSPGIWYYRVTTQYTQAWRIIKWGGSLNLGRAERWWFHQKKRRIITWKERVPTSTLLLPELQPLFHVNGQIMHVEDDDGSNDASDLVENLKIIIIGWKSSHDHGPLKTIKALEYVLMAEKLTGAGDAIAPLHVMSWKAFFNPPCLCPKRAPSTLTTWFISWSLHCLHNQLLRLLIYWFGGVRIQKPKRLYSDILFWH